MLVVSDFNNPLRWFRTELNGPSCLWVTDWTDGVWVVAIGDTYSLPNLSLSEAMRRHSDLSALWRAVLNEYEGAKPIKSRVLPGCVGT